MSIKLEAGKYYKDNEGNVRGPMVPYENSEYSFKYLYTDSHGFQRYECFMDDGSYYRDKTPCYQDLIEEVDGMNQSESNVQKTPIGLIPQNIFLELQNKQRVQDILDACSRYNEANKDIPQEWIDELSSRRGMDVLDPKSEPHETEKPAYMKDFEYNGEVYSVVQDYGSCKECDFRNQECSDANNTFENIAGVRCSTAPVSIHFVKKQ